MPLSRFAIVATILAVASSALGAQSQPTLIVNASVLDGTGAPARSADVRILDGRIQAVGNVARGNSDRVIDARGLTLAPGFIDTHSHHDWGLLDRRDALAAVSQGITTIVVGQDGGSQFPVAEFLSRLEGQPPAVNLASYVGHGVLRRRVMGDDFRRTASDAEVQRMRELLQEELDAGALGLSTGLEYDPGIYSTTREVVELAKVAAAAGGRYISHIRSEDRDFWLAVDEILGVGRDAHIPVQISHAKLAMRALWGQGPRLIAKLDSARHAGIQVTADIYPYTMWQSTLTVLYPKRNFSDRAETEFILREVAAPEDLVIGDFALDTSYAGRNVAEIARLRGSDPATTLMSLIAESQARGASESVVAKGMDERDIATIMKWRYSNICSDGTLAGAHPRGFGSFPRVLGRYVLEDSVLTLPEAIRKMTSLSASNMGIADRGIIREGMRADLVLFDPATVTDHATIRQPHAKSTGIDRVFVNGEIVFENGTATGASPGQVIRRAGVRRSARASVADSIERFVRAEMRQQKIPGLAVGIVNRGEVTVRGYGYANVEHAVPVTAETIFQSGSLGKMFTAAAVMLLVEDGKLALSDPLTKFFPDAPATWRDITLRHLLTHTSGIPDYTTSTFNYRRDYTEDELARIAYTLTLEFPAGSRWNYSNTGYALLGFAVRKSSGTFYGDVLRERVFKPLGMTSARVISEADIVPNRAAGYRLVNGELKNQEWVAPQLNTTADGSLYLSLRDILAWNDAVKRRAILSAESWDQILTPVRLASGKSYPYGMGWALDERGGNPLQQHGGAWQGFKAQLSRFIGADLDVIVLANVAQADLARVADGIAAIVNQSLALKKPAPIADTEPDVTARVLDLLGVLREGQLRPADFAYVRAGFFPDAARAYERRLKALGDVTEMQLLERRGLGDDDVYLYALTFARGEKGTLRIGFAPDRRISIFSLRPGS